MLLDMMSHSIEVGRLMLTEPGRAAKLAAAQPPIGAVANLKWSRPNYMRDLKSRRGEGVDYSRRIRDRDADGALQIRRGWP